MDPVLINLLTFAGAFCAVFAATALLNDMVKRNSRSVSDRINEQSRLTRPRRTAQLTDFRRIASEASEEVGEVSFAERIELMLEQSGLNLTSGRLMWMSAGSGFLAAAFGLLAMSSVVFALALGLICSGIPTLYVQFRRKQRLEAMRGQLPDAFDLMARVLRAGQTMSQAFLAVADEFQPPIAEEFGYCHEQMNLGLAPEAALRDLARRTGLVEIKIFVLAVVVHRQTGGNLAELLDKLSAVVRDRFRISGLIRSLTAQGRLQASILLGLPPAMFVLLMVIRPEYEMMLLDYPLMIAGALTAMSVGAFWVRRIIHFDY